MSWMTRSAGRGVARAVIAVLVLVSLALSPAHAQGAGAPGKTYTLGALLPLSGPNATYGEIFGKAIELAVKTVNASGRLEGRLEVVYEDSQALPQRAVVGMNKLVNVDRVPFVLSAFSGVSKAVAPIGNRQKVLVVNGGGVGPDLAELGDYFLNVIPLVDQEVAALLPYAVGRLGVRRIAAVYVNDPLGQGVMRVIAEECRRLGCEVAIDLRIDPLARDFQAEVAKLRTASPDAVYLASYGQQQNIILKQLRDGGVKAQAFGYSSIDIPDTRKLAEAEGAIFTSERVNWTAGDERTRAFVDAFKKAHGTAPTFYQANYYNAVMIFADLARHLESRREEVTGESLLRALHEIKDFAVVGGGLRFQPNGTVKMDIQINRLKGGQVETLEVVPAK